MNFLIQVRSLTCSVQGLNIGNEYKLISGVYLYPEGGVRVSKGMCPNLYPLLDSMIEREKRKGKRMK